MPEKAWRQREAPRSQFAHTSMTAVAATLQMRADHLVDRGVVLDDEYVGDGFHGKQDNTRGCVGVGIFKQS